VIEHRSLFIDGRWVDPAGSDVIEVVSPHTEQPVGRVPHASSPDVDRAVESARRAFDSGEWPRLSPVDRAKTVTRLADAYESRLEDMAQLITLEMGSPISFARLVQAGMPLGLLRYYSDLASEFAFEEERNGLMGKVLVVREPVGVVAAIAPWNVPQCIVMQKLAPALIAGCTVVLKPSPETPLDAYLLAELAKEVGLPPGVLNIVPADRAVSEYLVGHPLVDKVSFTGSTTAGRRIAALCGENLKRCALELGGKSAAIVLDDADLTNLVTGLRFASLMNTGQACVAQTRILASKNRYAEVCDAIVGLAESLSVGDPSDPATDVGPLVSSRQRERVEGYIARGQREGAVLATGGGRPGSMKSGWYVEPTVFTHVDNDMSIAREEIFGPVLAVIPFTDEADAVRIANDSSYGLAGSVWTRDVDHGIDIARRIRTGTYGVNQYSAEFCAPFGGYKSSGIGREMGPEGLSAYLEYKSIAPLEIG
jgi:aldehyde dehydrogenase (NAD+)